ncbi:MAG: glycosyltransferase [Caldilineaceae bacterium]|nr:glycosyltransferase [Caldilineaceae bacterium]
MARILFLTQVLPYPLNSGAKVRAYYVLRYLTQHHTVSLVSFIRANDSEDAVAHLRQFCASVQTAPMHRSRRLTATAALRSLGTGLPLLIERDETAAMYQLLEQVVAEDEYDYIHADQTSMARYARWVQDRLVGSGIKPVLVLDAHNALFKVVTRLAEARRDPVMRCLLQREAKRLTRYEKEAYARFDHVVFVTEEDRADFDLPSAAVIPICREPAAQPVVRTIDRPFRVTFIGPLHWPPNADGVRWMLHEIWPRIVARKPHARLTIIGADPPADLIEASESALNVEVTGYVDDLLPYLAETAAFIVPLRAGGGMRVKIIDGWTWGLPIVSTSVGAEGIETQQGRNILLADGPVEFADRVLDLFSAPALATSLRASGRATVEEHYDWRCIYSAWAGIYGENEASLVAAEMMTYG